MKNMFHHLKVRANIEACESVTNNTSDEKKLNFKDFG